MRNKAVVAKDNCDKPKEKSLIDTINKEYDRQAQQHYLAGSIITH